MKSKKSVIIPVVNEQETIVAAVRSAWAAGADEVIVVDGGSSDRTCQLAQSERARLIHSALGRARQQNAGAQVASGDIFVFLHADCQLGPECLQQIDALATDPHVYGAFQQDIEARGLLYRAIACGNAARVRWAGLAYGDQGIFVSRAAFLQVGGFPDVQLMEDVMLMQRLDRFGRPGLLPGPIRISARRWQRRGVVAQTVRNWSLLAAFFCGTPPAQLSRYYPRHDTE